MKKVTQRELKRLRQLHDKVCEHCDGCSLTRCSFAEGYHRGVREALQKPNDVLRSTHQIAFRKGKKTNWGAFIKVLEEELRREHEIMYPRN